MQVVVLTNESLKEELLFNVESSIKEIVCIDKLSRLHEYKEADVFIDLLFEKEDVDTLQQLLPKLVIINSVVKTLSEINSSFVRINGWPTFLKSGSIEVSSLNEDNKR